ncbi:MAG: hypothetical protein AAFX76_01145 [Planctomycetota bacterium]
MKTFPPYRDGFRVLPSFKVLGLLLFGLLVAGCATSQGHHAAKPYVVPTKAAALDAYAVAEAGYHEGYRDGRRHYHGTCGVHPHRGDVAGYRGDAWRLGYRDGLRGYGPRSADRIHAWVDAYQDPVIRSAAVAPEASVPGAVGSDVVLPDDPSEPEPRVEGDFAGGSSVAAVEADDAHAAELTAKERERQRDRIKRVLRPPGFAKKARP